MYSYTGTTIFAMGVYGLIAIESDTQYYFIMQVIKNDITR